MVLVQRRLKDSGEKGPSVRRRESHCEKQCIRDVGDELARAFDGAGVEACRGDDRLCGASYACRPDMRSWEARAETRGEPQNLLAENRRAGTLTAAMQTRPASVQEATKRNWDREKRCFSLRADFG